MKKETTMTFRLHGWEKEAIAEVAKAAGMSTGKWIRWVCCQGMLPGEVSPHEKLVRPKKVVVEKSGGPGGGPPGNRKRSRWCMVCQMKRARGQVLPEECGVCKW